MRQLVRQQSPSLRRMRRILARSEREIGSHGIGPRVDARRRLMREAVDVNAHLTEVHAEARLEVAAGGRVERLPR